MRPAIEFGERTIRYTKLDGDVDRAVAALERRGLGAGQRVAVLSGNCPEYVAVVFACARTGMIVVPLNWRLSPDELAYQLEHSGAALLLAADELRGLAESSLERVSKKKPALAPLTLPPPTPVPRPPDVEVRGDTPLFILYTSGTTGRPKGAVLTHANCFWTNLSLDRSSDVGPDDVVLQVLPQFHVGGWNCQPMLAWWKGAVVVLEKSFDPGRVLQTIAKRGVTTMMGVPANYLFLAEHPDFEKTDLSSLRYVLVGGAPMPESLLLRWQERGVRIVQGYGLTEASPNVLALPAEDAERKIGHAGKPYPHVEVGLADAATGEIVDGPGSGELLVRGPNVFAGYWANDEATIEALRSGWLHTGDVAERDGEGFYKIKDRLKDMYISGGENVYPAEVESVLHAHPAVAEAAVVGVADERWGEAGLAVVVLRQGSRVEADDLLSYCGEHLARFKVPRDVRFVDALPRSGISKVNKLELRRRFAKEPAG